MTSNPMINSRAIENVIADGKPMTISGSINKTLILLLMVILSGSYTWNLCATGFSDKVNTLMIFGIIAGFITCLVTCFRPQNAKILAPVYALCEGLVLGSVSFMFNSFYNGIVVNAVMATVLTFLVMLFAYKTKLIQATEKFTRVIIISTIAIAIFYFVGWIGAFLGHPMTIFNGSITGIVISFVICCIAALNFILDFNFIEQASERLMPDYMEWYGAFSLLVTLVWLYLEILRLLAQLQSRK